MTEERNRATIRDYFATLRRRRLVIIGVVVVAAAVAGALALSKAKTYTAQASLQALDISQSAGFAGLQQAQQNLPATTSAQLAQAVTRSDVLQVVKRKLGLPQTVDQIRSKISVTQDQQSNFVLLNATASTASGAATLANTAARAVTVISNAGIRSQYAAIAAKDNRESAALLRRFAGKPINRLSATEQAQFQANSQEAQQLEQIAARIVAFSKAVTVAQVVAPASVPDSPSGPHPVTNIILGAVVGLLLALLVVWFIESLDRRLRRPDEIESALGLSVVGAVPKGALGQTPGRDENAMGLPAFRMIRTQVRFLASGEESEDPRSLLVTSAMSGEGKTTVSLGLALSAAASGLTTLLIEADVHRPVHAQRLGLNRGPGLADYLRGRVTPPEILQTYRFVDPSLQKNGSTPNGNAYTLTCITAGDVTGFQGAQLGTDQFAEVIADVKKAYDLVVIDSAPLMAVAETSELVALVDAVALCVRMGKMSVDQARAARAALDRLPTRPTGLVLTDLEHDVGGYYGYAYEYSQSPEPKAHA
jgi:polysaccharide biosynthesis transport protein